MHKASNGRAPTGDRQRHAKGRTPPRQPQPTLAGVTLEGLTQEEVKVLLGPPSLEQSEFDGWTVWYYDAGAETRTVYFREGMAHDRKTMLTNRDRAWRRLW